MSTPATPATPPPERDAQLLNLGQQCSHASCLLVDFLPFKCHHCSQSFCQEHFRVEAHQCAKYDESKHNRVAPNCPLCNKPVAVAPGQDPNIRMDHHLDRECSVVVGQKKASSTPRCKKATCNKVLFAPIRCDKCREQFCPAHRFPGDHVCSAAASSNTPSTTRPTNPRPNLPNFANSAKELNTKATAARTAAFGAIKKSASATTAAVSSAVNNASTSASGSGSGTGTGKGQKVTMPFNKTDRPFGSLHTAPSTRSRSSTVVSAPAVTIATSIPTTANADNVTNATTTATTTTVNDDHTNDEPPNVPPPVINTWSFMPPPIFATA